MPLQPKTIAFTPALHQDCMCWRLAAARSVMCFRPRTDLPDARSGISRSPKTCGGHAFYPEDAKLQDGLGCQGATGHEWNTVPYISQQPMLLLSICPQQQVCPYTSQRSVLLLSICPKQQVCPMQVCTVLLHLVQVFKVDMRSSRHAADDDDALLDPVKQQRSQEEGCHHIHCPCHLKAIRCLLVLGLKHTCSRDPAHISQHTPWLSLYWC